MAQKIYTRIVLDWDGNTLEEEALLWEGPIALCMPSDGGGGPAGGDGDRGSGGSTGGSGSESDGGDFGGLDYGGGGFGLGGMAGAVAEGALAGLGSDFGGFSGGGDVGGDFGGMFSTAPATSFSSAIEAAFMDNARDVFGSMGLAGAYAGADTGMGFGDFAGAVGTDVDFSLPGLWNDVISTVFDKPAYTALDAPALGFAAYNKTMADLTKMTPDKLANQLNNLNALGMFDAKDFEPLGLATITPGRQEMQAKRAKDMGLTSYDTMNATFAKDIHNAALSQQVADINAAARATSYESVVNAAIGSGATAMKGAEGMTTADMKDLAQISVPEIAGLVASFANPATMVGGVVGLAGMLSNDITTRDVLGNFSRGLSLSSSLGTALSVANLMAGGIPGLDVVSSLLGVGFGAAGYTAAQELGREFGPGTVADIQATARSLGVDVDGFDTASSSGMSIPSAPREESAFASMPSRGNSGGGVVEEAKPAPLKTNNKIVSFMSGKTTVKKLNGDLYDKMEEPWYGKNKKSRTF